MDRQTVVEVSNILNQGKTPNNSLQIIVEYCREKGKQEDAILAFISVISTENMLIRKCLEGAMNYYKTKFKVCELYSAPNSLGIRNLLLIY